MKSEKNTETDNHENGLFKIGALTMTDSAYNNKNACIFRLLNRHVNGDHGDVNNETFVRNVKSVDANKGIIYSEYKFNTMSKLISVVESILDSRKTNKILESAETLSEFVFKNLDVTLSKCECDLILKACRNYLSKNPNDYNSTIISKLSDFDNSIVIMTESDRSKTMICHGSEFNQIVAGDSVLMGASS